MSPMCHYMYYKSDIILSKTDKFIVFSVRMSVCQQWSESDAISTVACLGAFGWHNVCTKIASKRCSHFIWSAYY